MKSVVTFYRFVALTGLDELRSSIDAQARKQGIKGTVLLADEGINGTLAGSLAALEGFIAWLRSIGELADLQCRYSAAQPHSKVFYRLKVRIKPEIVSLGQPGVDVIQNTGTHVDAAQWNDLLDDPDVLVIDTRNDYEVGIGSFPGALNPRTQTFREFPDYVRNHLDRDQQPRVAMYCTGGIRCEKASSYLLEQGFSEVYQLDGGILSYLETVVADSNRWTGECFVFDQRVSLDSDLKQGSFQQCFACRRPLAAGDLESPDYVAGVSCPQCIEEHDDKQRDGFAERARQVALAGRRGSTHIGDADQPSSSDSRCGQSVSSKSGCASAVG